ncbi:hypothetical protein Bca4012_010796 [Brassica carinata]
MLTLSRRPSQAQTLSSSHSLDDPLKLRTSQAHSLDDLSSSRPSVMMFDGFLSSLLRLPMLNLEFFGLCKAVVPLKLENPLKITLSRPSQAHSLETLSSSLSRDPLNLTLSRLLEMGTCLRVCSFVSGLGLRLSRLRLSQALTLNHFKMTKDGNKTSWRRLKRGLRKDIPMNKYDTSRKKYTKFRKLTKNRIWLGFDDMGKIGMSDYWWSEREKECLEIRRSVWKEEFNMDLFEEEFRAVVVTGAEGWSAQHGEASLNSRVGGDDGDEADSQPAAETQALETETQPQAQTETQLQTQPAAQTHSKSSRKKRRRKEKDMVVEACDKRTEALVVKNRIANRMLEREEASSVENVLEILYALPGVIKWSPLYEAAMEPLMDSEGNRKGFITMKTD